MLTANTARLFVDTRFSSHVTDRGDIRIVKLKVKNIDSDDTGVYTCEVMTKPVITVDVKIRVIGECI